MDGVPQASHDSKDSGAGLGRVLRRKPSDQGLVMMKTEVMETNRLHFYSLYPGAVAERPEHVSSGDIVVILIGWDSDECATIEGKVLSGNDLFCRVHVEGTIHAVPWGFLTKGETYAATNPDPPHPDPYPVGQG